ncbi:MAG TPA: 1,4-alpha-glucan branching protein GlgB [Rhabdochlamydiaceae bacterium]|nr:1,4-alpha-glucan branching protein GlgB [Rhabdochlamydiaceae bacterium]
MLQTRLFDLHNPHDVLGLHGKVIRLWRPGASSCHLEVKGKIVEAKKIDPAGLFEAAAAAKTGPLDYKIYHSSGKLFHDPYAFSPTFGEIDAHLFNQGTHYKIFNVLGGRLVQHEGVAGAKFAVWAPNATAVSLVGDFNLWDGRAHPMRSMGASGVWELFVPGLEQGETYKFEIQTQDGQRLLKSDPYAYFSEVRPKTASRLFDIDHFSWTDEAWIKKRDGLNRPLNIYEVHLGSWKKDLGYRQLAHELAAYCKNMGFTHVELMPVCEHPLDESWGYQVSGYYAATSRFGSPEDFQYFVNHLHQEGIGVIIDWVAAHFPSDDFSLARFDGTALYEHADPRQGFHPHWNTYIFNYGRHEVSNFLLANAIFWLEKMHVDGLRVDAVASMLYLDYGRAPGEWLPNVNGGKENLEAIEFIKHMNSIIHHLHPHAIMCAEESTSFSGVSHPLEWHGLGFDLKWNMGWMNDTLRYFHRDPFFRKYHQNDLSFGLIYAFSERFILVFSHDEVVHGKASLISKMPGDDWQKFASVRLFYSYMVCHPGKKLLFMGTELGQWQEWNCKAEIAWNLLQYDRHQQLQDSFRALNHFYQDHPALWEKDFESSGFEWIDFHDEQNSVISYLRKGVQQIVVCVHNFTPNYFSSYLIRLSHVRSIKEVMNTDREEFGGSGKINKTIEKVQDGFNIQLAPLATMVFEVSFDEK